MRLLAVAAAGLAVAQAFVVTPEIAQADSDIVNTMPFDDAFTATHQSMKLNCPGCPMLRPARHGKAGKKHHKDIPNFLELNFTVDHANGQSDRLLLNDFELYPKAHPWQSRLTAKQVAHVAELHHHPKDRYAHGSDVQLGYSLAVRPVHKEEDGQQLQLIDVELQIIEVGNTFVDGIPTVRAQLIKTPNDDLMIARLEQEELPEKLPAKADDCDTLICRLRVMVHDRIDALKKFKGHGCGGRRKGQQQQQQQDGDYRVVYRHRAWSRLFRNIATYVLLPVLIGIVAGVTISILGMAAGTFAVFLWRLIYRRQSPFAGHHCRRRGTCRKANTSEIAVLSEEKTGLMEEQEEEEEMPPKYEEAGVIKPDAS